MKKAFFSIVLLISVFAGAKAETKKTTSCKIEGTTIKSVKSAKAEPVLTKYTYEDKEGNKYPVMLSVNGRAFVLRTSKKTGKEYKQYLDAETSAQIAREYNKNNNK